MRRRILVVICALACVHFEGGWTRSEFGSILVPRKAFEDCKLFPASFGLDLSGGVGLGRSPPSTGLSPLHRGRSSRDSGGNERQCAQPVRLPAQRWRRRSDARKLASFARARVRCAQRSLGVGVRFLGGTSLTMRLRCEAGPGVLRCARPRGRPSDRPRSRSSVDLSRLSYSRRSRSGGAARVSPGHDAPRGASTRIGTSIRWRSC